MAVARAIWRSWRPTRGRLREMASLITTLRASFSSAPSLGLVCAPLLRLIKSGKRRVSITFTDRDGDTQTVRARLGDNLLEVAREYDIDLEGACDGTLSCSTCHLIVDPEWFPRVTDPLTEEEEDMLDLAYGLSDTSYHLSAPHSRSTFRSRLGCQVVVTEDLDGLKLTIPMATLDARET